VALSLPTTPDQLHTAWVTLVRARSPLRKASRPHRGWHRPGRVGTAPARLPGRRPCRAS